MLVRNCRKWAQHLYPTTEPKTRNNYYCELQSKKKKKEEEKEKRKKKKKEEKEKWKKKKKRGKKKEGGGKKTLHDSVHAQHLECQNHF